MKENLAPRQKKLCRSRAPFIRFPSHSQMYPDRAMSRWCRLRRWMLALKLRVATFVNPSLHAREEKDKDAIGCSCGKDGNVNLQYISSFPPLSPRAAKVNKSLLFSLHSANQPETTYIHTYVLSWSSASRERSYLVTRTSDPV